MKKQYIRQVRKDLHIPRSAKTEVVRDLQEILRLRRGARGKRAAGRGAAGDAAGICRPDCGAVGFDSAARRRRNRLIQIAISLAVAAAAFALYAAAAAQRVPPGAIGQADAMTNIRIEGAGFDVTLLLLTAGILAAAFAILQLVRAARSGRRAA